MDLILGRASIQSTDNHARSQCFLEWCNWQEILEWQVLLFSVMSSVSDVVGGGTFFIFVSIHPSNYLFLHLMKKNAEF